MNYIKEPEKTVPILQKYETVVAGGGIAGISAALAAARNGSKTMLIEREFMLGGLATAGLVTIYLPLCDGTGRQVSFGIAEELLRLSVRHGYEGKYCPEWLNEGTREERRKKRFEVQYNPYVFAIEAEQLLKSSGVTILYGTVACDALTENGKITHLILENKSGRSAVELKTVIDTTGDADICNLSGENTVIFGQGNVPAAWSYVTENGTFNLKQLGACDIPDTQKTKEQLNADRSSVRFTGLDADELTRLVQYSHKTLLDRFLKGGGVSPERTISSIATIPQIRMTRRIDGIFTQNDGDISREHTDSVGLFSDWRKAGPVYELPFSTLYGKKISNLITAGRCISVTDSMWDITRVIPVCAVSGQAAGSAAAITDNFADTDIKRLQKLLKSTGVMLHEKDL